MIGWVYESPRDKQKQADQDLEDFYAQDRIDDLEATKDAEIEALQEQIDAWDLYLKALEWRYNEYDRMERDRLLQQLLNVETEEEIREQLVNDMNEFNLSCEGSYKAYIGIFTNFLDEYRQNLEQLAELNRQQISLMNASQFMGSNNASISSSGGSSGGGSSSSNDTGYDFVPGGGWTEDEMEEGFIDSGDNDSSKKDDSWRDKYDGDTSWAKDEDDYVWGMSGKKSYSKGLLNGPVNYTGLAMLHGTPSDPEFVLNSDQAYNIIKNLAMAKKPEVDKTDTNNSTSYIVQGDVILQDVNNPQDFWKEVTNAMNNRWNITKNKR